MSSGVAPGPTIIAIGSPGATRSSTNTTTSTPNSVGSAHSKRFRSGVQAITCYALALDTDCASRYPAMCGVNARLFLNRIVCTCWYSGSTSACSAM